MAQFAYNNVKITSIGFMPFELNCGYHSRVFYKDDVDPRSKSKVEDELTAELQALMSVCRENLHHSQQLQKRANDKAIKPKSYALWDKIWLNSKYVKTKCNRKLEAKFFGPFRGLYKVGKQAYKFELPKRWRIHDVFHVLQRKQDTTMKGRVDEKTSQLEFEKGSNGEEYKIEGICDSAVYAKESEG